MSVFVSFDNPVKYFILKSLLKLLLALFLLPFPGGRDPAPFMPLPASRSPVRWSQMAFPIVRVSHVWIMFPQYFGWLAACIRV